MYVFQVHNYMNNMTSHQNFNSVMATLTIKDPEVANAVLDQTNCETILLIPDQSTAMELLMEEKR